MGPGPDKSTTSPKRRFVISATACTAAANGSTALEIFGSSAEPIRLVVTDANMPETDGFALAEQIQRDPELGVWFFFSSDCCLLNPLMPCCFPSPLVSDLSAICCY